MVRPNEPVAAEPNAAELAARVQTVADGIRRRVLAHVLQHGEGYLSQACSAAELLATLYTGVLHLEPSAGPLLPPPFSGTPGPGRPGWQGGIYNGRKTAESDRFFFSPVHYALVLYAALVEVGRLSPAGLADFNRDGSTIEMIGAEHSPGIETTAGSLAQALSVAGGVALARKLRGDSGRVWVFMSDGEFQEGQTWEAFAAASYHGLHNLGVVVDVNGYQCDGRMDGVMLIEPLADRLRSFGAQVAEVDAHDPAALLAAAASPHPEGALVVLGRSDPCRGIAPLAERVPTLHYLRFRDDAERQRYAEVLAAMGGR